MELIPGKVVYLNHYSGRDPIVSSIVETKEQFVKVRFTKDFLKAKVRESDPIVMSYEDDKSLFTCEGYVKVISTGDSIVEIRVDNCQEMSNNRVFERFPVSLYGSVKLNKNKKRVAVVKNISLSGMAITTKQDMKQGQNFVGEVYIDDRLINFTGEVAWKKNDGLRYEYGIKTIYPDYIVKNTVKLYLSMLKEEHESYARNEFNISFNKTVSN